MPGKAPAPKLRIGLLANAQSIHTVKIADGLVQQGYEVFLYTLANHSAPETTSIGVQHRPLPFGGAAGYFLNVLSLRARLRHDRVDVLNAHYASGYGTLGRLAGFHPYALSVWGSDVYDFPEAGSVKRGLIRRNLESPELLLSTSEAMAERTRGLAPGRRVEVTPFGVDTAVFAPDGGAHDEIVVGFVKTITDNYGLDYLLRAFALVRQELPDIPLRLRIYGDGERRAAMENLAFELGEANHVTFYGSIPHGEVPDALRQMDIFCVPSHRESFGVAAVEAMAVGLPCITSDAPGLAEVMVDGETGFVVPRGDYFALAAKLIVLIQDPKLRSTMGDNGRRRVRDLYEWADNIATIGNLLRHLAGSASRSR